MARRCIGSLMVLLMVSGLTFGQYTVPHGSAPTIDGNLSDWAGASWINLDMFWNSGETAAQNAYFDLTESKCAIRWNNATNKIYVAVTTNDPDQNFWGAVDPTTTPPTWPEWDKAEQVEIYFDAGNSNNTYYSYDTGWYREAQQFVGFRTTAGEDHMALGGPSGLMDVVQKGIMPAFKSSVNGNVISYEMELTPYQYLNIGSGYDLSGLGDSTIRDLEAGQVIGFDVCITSNFTWPTGGNGMGQAYFSTGSDEWFNAANFPDFTLTGGVVNIPGDANGDGAVDVGDLGILAGNYGMESGATWSQGDFNGDGAVDVGDLGILAGNYGTTAAASVPEPATLLVLVGGGLLAGLKRKA